MQVTKLLLAALCGLASARSAPSSVASLSFWPSDVGGELSHELDGDEIEVERKEGGGLLAMYAASLDLDDLQISLHPAIRSLKVAWIPPSDRDSSTFSSVIAHARSFFRSHAVGVHLQVELDSTKVGSADVVEGNIRGLLDHLLPSLTEGLELQQGFLARSPCSPSNWSDENVQSLFQAPNGTSTSQNELCYASSFSIPDAATTSAQGFCCAPPCSSDTASSKAEKLIWSTPIMVLPSSAQLRAANLLVQSDGKRAQIDYTEVHMASTRLQISRRNDLLSTVSIAAATLIKQDFQLHVDYQLLSPSEDISFRGTTTLPIMSLPIPATMAVAVEGEGFHRHLTVKLNVQEKSACAPKTEASVLLILPLSHTVYADLDEMRRLERFGHFQVHAFEKHIEIERPSSVSSQHVIAVQLKLSSTRQLDTEIPMHFRYQAPSTTELYRSAVVVAPEALLYCHPRISSSPESASEVGIEGDVFVQHLKQRYHSGRGRTAVNWHSIALASPIDAKRILTPVGFLPSQAVVSSITFASTCVAAAMLVWIAARRQQPTESGQREKFD